MIRYFVITAVLITMLISPLSTQAQQPYAVYVVQPGDTVTLIAMRYNLRIEDVARANQLVYPYYIYVGEELILPNVPRPTPTPQFSGYSPSPLVIAPSAPAPSSESQPFSIGQTHVVQPGETLYSIAASYGLPVNHLIIANGITNPDLLQLGQELQIPNGPPPTPSTIPDPFQTIDFSEPIIRQGRTLVVTVNLSQVGTVRGDMNGTPLFFTGSGQHKWALAAIHAMAEPGQYPIQLIATLPDGREISTFRNVTVVEGSYGTENIELIEGREQLLDPDIIEQEWSYLTEIWTQVTYRPLWEGLFLYPVDGADNQVTSGFGTRRTYNNGPPAGFHGGTDFGGGVGRPIYAPAAGRVVLAESLNVRGNAVIIDHGMGLYSGYWHQTEIVAHVGQYVEPGDLIGYIGDTGLVTGPHLHWEIRLNGFAVEPLQWTQQQIP